MGKDKWQLYSDGGARGNPGPAGIGIVLLDPRGVLIAKGKRFIGSATNNIAEYSALIFGLEKSLALGVRSLDCYLDSELVVRQLNGEYRVRDKSLKGYYLRVISLAGNFIHLTFNAIPREKNCLADKLVNEAIDASKSKTL